MMGGGDWGRALGWIGGGELNDYYKVNIFED